MYRCRWVGELGRSPSVQVRRGGRGHGRCCVVSWESIVRIACVGVWAGLA